jgi:hypothetical protein
LVIFDRVQSLDPSWRKAWLCHFQGKPEVMGGKLVAAEIPGHIEDFDGGTVQTTWADGVLQPPNPADPGRLFIKTFLPKKHIIRRIGGNGYEAWSNGKNRTGDDKKILDRVDAGRWRIEISPTEPQRFDTFLHLIHIGDTKTNSMPVAELIEAENQKMVGLSTGGWIVLFGRTGQVQGEVVYPAPKGKVEHLLTDLSRGSTYQVTGANGGTQKMTASPEGTLRFLSSGPTTIRIKPVE